MSSRFSKLLGLSALFVLASCRFTSDNTAPNTALKINLQEGENCPNLKEEWSAFEKEDYDSSSERMHSVLLCHVDSFEKKFDSVKIPRLEGLYPEEAAALAKPFFQKDRPLSAEEASILFLAKSLVTRESESSLKKSEFQTIRSFIEAEGRLLLKEVRSGDIVAVLEIILSKKAYPENISLRPEHLHGLSHLAERFVKGLDLEKLRPRLASLVSSLNPFFGYSPLMKRLPLGRFLNKLPEIIRVDRRMGDLAWIPDNEKLSFDEFAAEFQKRLPRIKNDAENFATSVVSGLGLEGAVSIKQNDWARLIALFERLEWTSKDGDKLIELALPTEQLASIAQRAVSTFAGRQDAFSIEGADLHAALKDFILLTYMGRLSGNLNLEKDDTEKLKRLSFSEIEIVHFQKLFALLQSKSGYWGNETTRSVSLWSFHSRRLELRLMQSLLSGFDKDGDGLLDMSRDLENNEFRELLKMADKLLSAANKATSKQDESKVAEASSEQKSKTQFDELLSSKKATLVLSVFADNMTAASKGDGAINTIELFELVEKLQDIQYMQSRQQEMIKADGRWAAIQALTGGYSDSPFNTRASYFSSYLYSVISPDHSRAHEPLLKSCSLRALSEAENVDELFQLRDRHCGEKRYDEHFSKESREFLFALFKPWMQKTQKTYPVDKVLSNDESVLAMLMSSWVENVALVARPLDKCSDSLRSNKECVRPISLADFEAAATKSLGPSSLRILPPKVRAPLLAAGVPPAKVMARALFSAPTLLELARSRNFSAERLTKLLNDPELRNPSPLSYLDLLAHSWALAQFMNEIGSSIPTK